MGRVSSPRLRKKVTPPRRGNARERRVCFLRAASCGGRHTLHVVVFVHTLLPGEHHRPAIPIENEHDPDALQQTEENVVCGAWLLHGKLGGVRTQGFWTIPTR